MPDILVLGATGFTGKLITRYLLSHSTRHSFTITLAARSSAKLRNLVQELNTDCETLLLDVTDPNSLDDAIQNVKVVINTVGPFWKWGTPVVRACVRHGVHYVDLTGEAAWIRDIIAEFDYAATKTHAIIIPSSGFDSIPSDITVFLSNRTLKAAAGPTAGLHDSTTAFTMSGGVSGGTYSTFFTSMEDIPLAKKRAATLPWALSPIKGRPNMPLSLVHALPQLPGTRPKYGAFFVMGSPNTATVQRTAGLHALHALQASTPEASALAYGPEFRYAEFLQTSSRLSAIFLSLSFVLGYVSLTLFAPARWLLRKFIPQPGEGPSPEVQAKGFFVATNVTTAASGTMRVYTVMRGKGDPGYSLASIMIAESALALLDVPSLPELAHSGGVITPASALGDVLVRRLEESGRFEFSSEVVVEDEEARKTR